MNEVGGPLNMQPVERIQYLDGWRGLAITLVLISHFTNLSFFDEGRLGVDIFFVLSGMLMSRILFINRTPLPLFYWRRASRILPVFLLFIITIFSLSYIHKNKFCLFEFLSTIFFARTYFPTDTGIWNSLVPIGHIWSLNIEEHSYVALSLLTLLLWLRAKEGYLLILLGITTISVTIYYAKHPVLSPENYEIRTECASGFIFLSAGYLLVKNKLTGFIKPWMPILALILAFLCYCKISPWWCSVTLAPFLLAFTVNHLDNTYMFFRKTLSNSILRYLGIWSYSIYLWQQPFYEYKNRLPAGVAFIIAMFVALASYYFFENPSRVWLNGKYKRKISSNTGKQATLAGVQLE